MVDIKYHSVAYSYSNYIDSSINSGSEHYLVRITFYNDHSYIVYYIMCYLKVQAMVGWTHRLV